MKISISVPSATAGGPPSVTVLGDDATGAFITGWLPDVAAVISTARYPRAAAVEKFTRNNTETVFPFRVNREHSSLADALNTIARHCATVPGLQGTVTVTQLGSSGATIRIEDAVISRVRLLNLSGVSTVLEYIVEGGAFLFNS